MYDNEITTGFSLAFILLVLLGLMNTFTFCIGLFAGRFISFAGSMILTVMIFLQTWAIHGLIGLFYDGDILADQHLDLAAGMSVFLCIGIPLFGIGLLSLRSRTLSNTAKYSSLK